MERELVVLIVDDHSGVRDALEQMVESWRNVHLLSCGNFLDAVRLMAGAAGIDLLICDVCLPGDMTGIDVAELAVTTFPDISIVLISADPLSEISGITARYSFLRKPFDREYLVAHIEGTHPTFNRGMRRETKGCGKP